MGKKYIVNPWKRILMSLIDIIFVVIYYGMLYLLIFNPLGIFDLSKLRIEYDLLLCLLPFFLSTVSTFFFGGTLGKIICKSAIIEIGTCKYPSFKTTLIREFFQLLSLLSFSIGFFILFFNGRRQTWYDSIAGTLVINKKADHETLESEKTKRSKFTFIIASALITLFFIFVTVLSFLYFSEEEPNPEINRILNTDYSKDSDPYRNAFYYMVGFSCPTNEDSFVFANNFAENQRNQVHPDSVAKKENESEAFIEEYLTIINPVLADSESYNLSEFLKQRELIVSFFEKNAFLNERFIRLKQCNYLHRPYKPSIQNDIPDLTVLTRFYRLRTLYLVSEFIRKSNSTSLEELRSDLYFFYKLTETSDDFYFMLIVKWFIEVNLNSLDLLTEYYKGSNIPVANFCNELKYIPINNVQIEKTIQSQFSELIEKSTFISTYWKAYKLVILGGIFEAKFVSWKQRVNRLLKEQQESDAKQLDASDVFYYSMIYNMSFSDFITIFSSNPHKMMNSSLKEIKLLIDLFKNNPRDLTERLRQREENDYPFMPFDLGTESHQIRNLLAFYDLNSYIDLLKGKSLIYKEKISENQINNFVKNNMNSKHLMDNGILIKWNEEKREIYFESFTENCNFNHLKVN